MGRLTYKDLVKDSQTEDSDRASGTEWDVPEDRWPLAARRSGRTTGCSMQPFWRRANVGIRSGWRTIEQTWSSWSHFGSEPEFAQPVRKALSDFLSILLSTSQQEFLWNPDRDISIALTWLHPKQQDVNYISLMNHASQNSSQLAGYVGLPHFSQALFHAGARRREEAASEFIREAPPENLHGHVWCQCSRVGYVHIGHRCTLYVPYIYIYIYGTHQKSVPWHTFFWSNMWWKLADVSNYVFNARHHTYVWYDMRLI